MGFKGNVESFSLADVFQNLAMNHQTGTLRITPERNPTAEEKYVYFQDGHVRFLSGSSRAPLLPPEVFLARGLLSKSEFDAALLRQTETAETLVATLNGMGYVNEQQVQDLLVHQIEEEIYDLFGWEAASFEFNEGPPPEGLFAAEAAETGWGISIQITHLIMEAARRVDEWERLRKVIPSQKEIFVVDLTVRKAIERGEMETDPVERRVAMLIDGARDVEDLVADSKLFKFEVYGALSGFLQSSIIRPATLNELNFSEGECGRLDLPKRRIKVLERILALGGENLRIRRELADQMSNRGQIEHACIHYSILASSELKDGHEESAIEIYKRILTIAPTNIKIRESLAALYAKRLQKRDASTQYSELFENLRDQHLLREARDAAGRALQNDPSNAKMRNALVELLLMEDNHEEAANQLEQLGDFAAKTRNGTLAAESYRRAMQYRKNIRPLKKKLNEVLLTKEDRAARRRRLSLSILFFAILLLACGGVYYIEMQNQRKFNDASAVVEALCKQSDELEKSGDLEGADAKIAEAITSLNEPRKVWSPFLRVGGSANSLFDELNRKDVALKDSVSKKLSRADRIRDELRQDARQRVEDFDYKGAKAKYEELLPLDKTPEEKAKDAAELAKVLTILEQYKDNRAKIAKLQSDPGKLFKDAADELRFVNGFIKQYSMSPSRPEDFPKSLTYPLLVTLTNVDEVNVELNGNPIQTIKANAPWQERILRYPVFPVRSSVVYKFSKRGYTSQSEDVTLHQEASTVEAKISLERDPVINAQFPNLQFDGNARFDDDLLYAGTSEGGLVEIDVRTKTPVITARYELEQPQAGIEKRIFGPIGIFKQTRKPTLFVYCTKAGYCAGLVRNGIKFESAWSNRSVRVIDPAQTGLDFPPTFFEQGGKPKLAIVTGTRIVVVDAESGTMVQLAMEMPINSFNKKVIQPTSGACFIEATGSEKDGGTLLVAGDDSNLHAFNLASIGGKPRSSIWITDLSKDAVMVNTAPVVVGDRVVVAGNTGSIRFFNLNGSREATQKEAAGGIISPPLVDHSRAYFACSGAVHKEGLSVIDLSAPDVVMKSRNDVPISLTPAALDKRVYFVTAPPVMLYAVDAKDINNTFWKYNVNRKVACPPVAHGSRVYILTHDGGLIGFDEPQ